MSKKIVFLISAGLLVLGGSFLIAGGSQDGDSIAQAENHAMEASMEGEMPAPPPMGEDYQKPSKSVLKRELNEMQYRVTQEEGTEPPFRNEFWDLKEEGIFVDIVSGEPLFSSTDKYQSGTGWPSFTSPLSPGNIVSVTDNALGMTRTEVRSYYGDSHLGHVFNDGPNPTGLRYCINSASLRFVPVEDLVEEGYEEFLPLFEEM